MIQAPSVEGSALDPEPSVKSASTADGSTSDIWTIRDIGPQRGRFRSGLRTVREIGLQRGRFALWYSNLP